MAEPIIKETPAQQQMRLDQERVRKEMHAKNEAQKLVKPPVPEFGDAMIFRVKMWKNGSFSGLWMLEVLNKYGQADEIVLDAETLPAVCEAIGNIFANRGY